MFDFFRSREKNARTILAIVLGIVAFSMVVTMLPSYGDLTGMGNPSGDVVATVNGEKITVKDVQMALRTIAQGRQIPPEVLQLYIPTLVNRIIAERALVHQSRDVGFSVSQEDLANTIRTQLPPEFLDAQGRLVNKDAYRNFLASIGQTVPEFENGMERIRLAVKLQNLLADGLVVSPQEAENEFRLQNERMKVEYVKFTPEDVRKKTTASAEEIQAYYNQNKNNFKVPAKRTIKYVVVDEGKIASQVPLSDQQLRAEYQKRLNEFKTVERVKASHILLKTQGKSDGEKKQLKAKIEDLLKQVKGGGNFEELAKKNSEDPSNAPNGGDLGFFTRETMVKPFSDAAFGLKPGQVSNVVETDFGYHIIKVTGREDARTKPFEEVRDQLAKELNRQAIFDRMQQAADQIRAGFKQGEAQGEAAAKNYSLNIQTAENVGPGDPLPELGAAQEVHQAIANLQPGQSTDVVQSATGDRLVVARVTGLVPERPAELKDVETQVREQVIGQKSFAAYNKQIQELTAKLKTNSDLRAVAKEYGLEVKTSEPFSRRDNIGDLGPAGPFVDYFNKPVGSIVPPQNVGGQTYAAKVIEKTPADMTQFAAQRTQLVEQLKRIKSQERSELLNESVLAAMEKAGKVKRNEELIRRLAESLRT